MYHQTENECFTLVSIQPDLSIITTTPSPRVKWIEFYKLIYPLTFKSYPYFLILKLRQTNIVSNILLNYQLFVNKINNLRYGDIHAIPSHRMPNAKSLFSLI